MKPQLAAVRDTEYQTTNKFRAKLLDGVPVTQHKIELAGISTSVLIGGEGPLVILLHGPGESSVWWTDVIQLLVKTHRVIVPDLPSHGESKIVRGELDEEKVFTWLRELILSTSNSAPILVGNILGGSIAARFTIHHQEEVGMLILVNSLGLDKFRPAPGFAFGLFRFLLFPSQKNFKKFLPSCMYDVNRLREKMGDRWEPFLTYNLECAQNPETKNAMKVLMKEVGLPKISSDKLSEIEVPTALIWGRYDRANPLKIAEAANKRYGWPLHVIDDTRDDPKLERPKEFVKTLKKVLPESIQSDSEPIHNANSKSFTNQV